MAINLDSSKHPRAQPQHRRLLLLSALGGFASIAPFANAELKTGVAPGANIALQNWNITVPADANGNTNGQASTVYPPRLEGASGYTSQWFYTASDGAMSFWTPVNGATTGGSNHPRSELREMIDASTNAVNWDSYGTSILDAQAKVIQVPPSDGMVIVGQVHGHGSAPLVLVYYKYDAAKKTGKLYAKLQGTPIQGPPFWQHVVASDIRLGQAFTYQIKVSRSAGEPAIAAVSANNGVPATMTMAASWDPETFYFKAGSYLHTYGTSATEGALVKFYRLAASHPANGLTISSNAALANAKIGRPYSATLVARGGIGGGSFSLVSGFPPAGLSLARDGSISGTPLASPSTGKANDFTVQVRDANGATSAKKFSILVMP